MNNMDISVFRFKFVKTYVNIVKVIKNAILRLYPDFKGRLNVRFDVTKRLSFSMFLILY